MFHACFWLPGVTYILLAALSDMELRRQNEEIIELQKKLLIEAKISNNTPLNNTDEDLPDPFVN